MVLYKFNNFTQSKEQYEQIISNSYFWRYCPINQHCFYSS